MNNLKWFLDRVGKEVLAHSAWWGYTRIVKIKNSNHAKYLHSWYYQYKHWAFQDYLTIKTNNMGKLTSLKLQLIINLNNLDTDLWCLVLNFGRKKSGRYNFPIIFKNYKQTEKLYDELEKLKGKTLDEVKSASESLYNKYKKYHYKN